MTKQELATELRKMWDTHKDDGCTKFYGGSYSTTATMAIFVK